MRMLLNRETIVQLFYRFGKAERSVHRLLDPAATWPEFQKYFSSRKRELVTGLVDQLEKQLPCSAADLSPQAKKAVVEAFRPAGLFRVLFGRLLTRWRSSWPFSAPEVQLMVSTWRSLLCSLERVAKPDAEVLIDLRRDLWSCGHAVVCRCWGMWELDQSKSIAHFRQTEWLKTIRLEDVMEEAA
jgi:hypothetical protein